MLYKVKVRVPLEVLDDSQIPLDDYNGESELALIVDHLSEQFGPPRIRANAQSKTALWQGVTIESPPLGLIGMTSAIVGISKHASIKIDPYTPPVRRPSRKVKKSRNRELFNRLIGGESLADMGDILEHENRPTSEPYRPR